MLNHEIEEEVPGGTGEVKKLEAWLGWGKHTDLDFAAWRPVN